MNTEPVEELDARRRRAVALTALGLLATAVASFAYLRPDIPASDVNPVLVSTNPMSFAFVTPSIGWASLFVVGAGSDAGQVMLFRTTDGAQHWQQQQLRLVVQTIVDPGTVVAGSAPPISVQMFGKTRGYMTLQDQLYRTNDGGAHWDSVGLPPSKRLGEVVFSDPSRGWLVAASSLYATRDGGNHWERLADPPFDASGLGFRRPTEAWLGSSGPGPPHVYISSDSGQSWQRHDLPAPAGRSWTPDRYFPSFPTTIQLLPGAGAIAAVGAMRCLATSTSSGTTSCTSGAGETFRLMSGDVGITWEQMPSPPGIVAYQDSTHWWAASHDALLKSTDAGKSWMQVAGIPALQNFSTLGILDSTHAWATVSVMDGYGLALTNDGWVHWTLANVPNPAISS